MSKHGELIRDKLLFVFIIEHPDILHTDNRKEFWNKSVDNLLQAEELSMNLELLIIHKVKVQLKHLINTFKIELKKNTIIYQNLMKIKRKRI